VTPVKSGHFSPLRFHFDFTILIISFETSTGACALHLSFTFAPAERRCSATLASLEVQSVL